MKKITNMKIPIKAYSKSQLAAMYGISVVTFMKWLELKGIEIEDILKRKIFTPREVEMIFNGLGEPVVFD